MATSLRDIATYFSVDGAQAAPDAPVDHDVSEALATVGEPNYNVAPTDAVPIVIEPADERLLSVARWGFIPFWDKSNKANAKMINARCETVATKNAFKRSIRSRRCLVPADGFYEWKRSSDGSKQPFYITSADGEMMALAGLYSNQRDETGAAIGRSVAILTGPPSDAMASVHDRMPIMVDPSRWDGWLTSTNDDIGSFSDLFEASATQLRFTEVSSAVNKVANNGPQLVEPLPTGHAGDSRQASLFDGT